MIKRSSLFIILGIIFLLIGIYMYLDIPDITYNLISADAIALSAVFLRYMCLDLFFSITGVILLVTGINVMNK